MSAIGFAHGGYLLPILGTLAKAGESTELALVNARLPPDIFECPFQPVPHILAVQFIEQTAHKMGNEDFGITSLSECRALTPEMIPMRGVALEPGGVQKMHAIVSIMNRTTTSVFQLVDRNDDLWIDMCWTHGEDSPPWSAELYVAGLILSALRGVLGADWQPSAMKMLSPRSQARASANLPNCPIQWNAQTVSVAIDRQDMAVRATGSAPHQGNRPLDSIPDLSDMSSDLIYETIIGLLRQEHRNLSDIADCFGQNKRSFQRQLDSCGLHYGQIVENFRIERAIKALRQEDVSVTDLSLELGYNHPQNFARAFRRRVGLNPRQYRTALSSHEI